jgi:pyridoxal phosphate enzyme (YggS family)
MDILVTDIRERYLRTLDRISAAARANGRASESVRLVVVTKAQPLSVVEAVVEAGVHILGENYPEEAVKKILALGHVNEVEWHMIGHVQSRKAGMVVEHFALLHSLDGYKLASRLDRFAAQAGRRLPVLLEFNVSGEESKYGWPAWQEERWPELLPDISGIINLSNLELRGLMTMPPFAETGEPSRPFFIRLRRLRDFLAGNFPDTSWQELSIGTSVDFEVAVQEGATLVRIGTAIVGSRPEKHGGAD